MKCCVIIPIGPGHEELSKRALSSVSDAIEYGIGAFDSIHIIEVDDTEGALGRSHARNVGVQEAGVAHGADWLFFLDADDLIAPTAFSLVSGLLEDYDAIWGEIYVADLKTMQADRRQNQISPITSLNQLLINDPFLTLQMGHFVKRIVAEEHPFNTDMNCGEDFDYYLRVWKEKRCIKIQHPLFLNVRGQHSSGPRSANGQDWRQAINSVFQRFCQENEVLASVPHLNKNVTFRLTNTLDSIQNHLARDVFFEIKELTECSLVLPSNPKILDIGSNIGNHALYFACISEAATIHCFEPIEAIAINLEQNFRLNDVPVERYKIFNFGIGSENSQASIDRADSANLGATSLKNDPSGTIEIHKLDSIYPIEIFDFLKIDVEGMELEALSGASQLIKRSTPVILIEIANTNKGHFFAWAFNNNYRIHRTFELVHASNYLLVPQVPRSKYYDHGTIETREWVSRIPLAHQQPPLGWSSSDYFSAYTAAKTAVEISVSNDTYELYNIQDRQKILSTKNPSDIPIQIVGKLVILNEILEILSDETLNQLLSYISKAGSELILFGIMDARWDKAFGLTKRYRDIEHYLCALNSTGYRLERYHKLPYKAAFGIDEQLDNQATLLHLIKNAAPQAWRE